MESEINRLNLGYYIAQILIPTEKVYDMRNGKKRTREKSYLPGYVFLEVRAKQDEESKIVTIQPEVVQVIKDVPGVVGFLGDEKGKIPVPLKQDEIKKILDKDNELKDMDEVMENPFNTGESVKVMDGPFNGFNGVIEEIYSEKKKLKVMIKIFGRNTSLELNYLQVERI